ncbi:Thermonuclease family protein [Candidatus Hepatincolaceae symbiont of Richtersius coronifer]
MFINLIYKINLLLLNSFSKAFLVLLLIFLWNIQDIKAQLPKASNTLLTKTAGSKVKLPEYAPEYNLITMGNLEVLDVIDGDTIRVKDEKGLDLKIRLMGIQAPELYATPVWDFALESKQALQEIIQEGDIISLSYVEGYKYDKYKRILAHVYSKDGVWANSYLLEKGLAFVYILANTPKMQELIAVEDQAISANLLFWQNNFYKMLKPSEAKDFTRRYKTLEGKILKVVKTKDSVWLQFESTGYKGFSVRIPQNSLAKFIKAKIGNYDNSNLSTAQSQSFLDSLENTQVRIRGYINIYKPEGAPFVEVISPDQVEILKELR